MKIAVIGVTGLVGEVLLDILGGKSWVTKVFPLGRSDSSKRSVLWRGESLEIMQDCDWSEMYATFIATPENIAKEWARIASSSSVIVDKSGAFRDSTPLVIPEINADIIRSSDKILSSPNCVVIPLAIVLHSLFEIGIISSHISTYQSVSGAGRSALNDFDNGAGFTSVSPCIGEIDANGDSSEERKIKHEARSILRMEEDFNLTVTAVRVPIRIGHGISLTCVFSRKVKRDEIIESLSKISCISLCKDAEDNSVSPVVGSDDIRVSRIRGHGNCWSMWISSDNLRRGAAVNAVGVVEYLYRNSINI